MVVHNGKKDTLLDILDYIVRPLDHGRIILLLKGVSHTHMFVDTSYNLANIGRYHMHERFL